MLYSVGDGLDYRVLMSHTTGASRSVHAEGDFSSKKNRWS